MATADELRRAAEHMRRRGVSNDGGRRSVQCIAAADELEREAARLEAIEAGGPCGGLRAYENRSGVLLHRDGWYRFRCTRCGQEGETTTPREHCDAEVKP